jgi:hypothetical protein
MSCCFAFCGWSREKINQGGTGLEELLKTHPNDVNRIEKINKKLTELNSAPASESNLFTSKYADFKKTLNFKNINLGSIV